MQLKDMAERLPVGTARTAKSPSSLNSFGSSPGRVDHFNILNRQNGQEPEPNTPMFSNGTTTPVFGNGEARNEAQTEKEWVEQDEPGVYITLTALAGGVRDLKRVRFRYKSYFTSPKRKPSVVIFFGLTVLFCFITAEKGLVRNKRNNGGQITEEESMNNTMYEWLTKPARKCLVETL